MSEYKTAGDKNLPFYVAMENIINNVKYGSVQVNAKVHDTEIIGIVLDSSKHVKYRNNEDGIALGVASMVEELQQARDEGKTGSITFTYNFKNGKMLETITQRRYTTNIKG